MVVQQVYLLSESYVQSKSVIGYIHMYKYGATAEV
jgi:hypothetical protein